MSDKRFFSNPGSPIRDVLTGKVKSDGSIEVIKVGEENFQEYIQSFEEEGNIGAMIARLMEGDTSVLSSRSGMYGDFTQFPKTYAEILQSMIDARNYFEELPDEVRRKFDNDFNKFFVSCEDPDFAEKIGLVVEPDLEKESEVVEP